MVTLRKVLIIIAVVSAAAICTLLLLPPFPKSAEKEYYSCRWQSGAVTTESYYAAFMALADVTESTIVLERGGQMGEIRASEPFSHAVEVFESGELAPLLAFRLGEVTRLERAALWNKYGRRGYYSGEFFAWDGECIFRTERGKFDEVFLLTGNLPKGRLFETGAKKLILGGDSSLTASALVGSRIESVEARAPYYCRDGAVYLQTAGGVRLISGLPNAETLEIACDYLDEGALSPCVKLKTLKLPSHYEGTLRMLFGETPVPKNLICL